MHRDLKPENLLLDADNNLKLADFGLSNVVHDGDFLKTSCGSPNYAAPEVISGNLYAGAEVDVWSCGVILYALLCGTLPFDDESIPNLFKKIKSGMYSLPSHLSQSSRDLILRMLVVDPIKRITIPEIRQHQWFLHKLPAYLSLPPELIEMQERYVDDEIVEGVCALPLRDVNPDLVKDIILNSTSSDMLNQCRQEIRVAYELLLDAKRHKQRIADVVLALQDSSRTPPSGSASKLTGLGTSPSSGSKLESATNALASKISIGTSVNPIVDSRDVPARRRRWYLGIQSKKDPSHVMSEVYKAMRVLNCVWYQVTNYRVLCLWTQKLAASARTNPSGSFSSSSDRPMGVTATNNPDSLAGAVGVGGLYSDSIDMDIGNSNLVNVPSSNNVVSMGGTDDDSNKNRLRIKVALSLYKVQQNIYLLDFQRIEGDAFNFMNFCALIITELKTLSAANRLAAANQQVPPPIPVPSFVAK